jgi:hypothetical protein
MPHGGTLGAVFLTFLFRHPIRSADMATFFPRAALAATVTSLLGLGLGLSGQVQAQQAQAVEPAAVPDKAVQAVKADKAVAPGTKAVAGAGVAATRPNGDKNYPTGVVPVPPKPKKELLTGAKLGDKAAIKAKAEAVQGQ